MSIRPAAASTCCVNVGVTFPWRMNVPSGDAAHPQQRGVEGDGNGHPDSREAPVIETGTVYGPLPTRISLGGASVIRGPAAAVVAAPAPVAPAAPAGGLNASHPA